MTSVSGGRRHGPLLSNRFLYKYFKTLKEIKCVTIKQKDNAEQRTVFKDLTSFKRNMYPFLHW